MVDPTLQPLLPAGSQGVIDTQLSRLSSTASPGFRSKVRSNIAFELQGRGLSPQEASDLAGRIVQARVARGLPAEGRGEKPTRGATRTQAQPTVSREQAERLRSQREAGVRLDPAVEARLPRLTRARRGSQELSAFRVEDRRVSVPVLTGGATAARSALDDPLQFTQTRVRGGVQTSVFRRTPSTETVRIAGPNTLIEQEGGGFSRIVRLAEENIRREQQAARSRREPEPASLFQRQGPQAGVVGEQGALGSRFRIIQTDPRGVQTQSFFIGERLDPTPTLREQRLTEAAFLRREERRQFQQEGPVASFALAKNQAAEAVRQRISDLSGGRVLQTPIDVRETTARNIREFDIASARLGFSVAQSRGAPIVRAVGGVARETSQLSKQVFAEVGQDFLARDLTVGQRVQRIRQRGLALPFTAPFAAVNVLASRDSFVGDLRTAASQRFLLEREQFRQLSPQRQLTEAALTFSLTPTPRGTPLQASFAGATALNVAAGIAQEARERPIQLATTAAISAGVFGGIALTRSATGTIARPLTTKVVAGGSALARGAGSFAPSAVRTGASFGARAAQSAVAFGGRALGTGLAVGVPAAITAAEIRGADADFITGGEIVGRNIARVGAVFAGAQVGLRGAVFAQQNIRIPRLLAKNVERQVGNTREFIRRGIFARPDLRTPERFVQFPAGTTARQAQASFGAFPLDRPLNALGRVTFTTTVAGREIPLRVIQASSTSLGIQQVGQTGIQRLFGRGAQRFRQGDVFAQQGFSARAQQLSAGPVPAAGRRGEPEAFFIAPDISFGFTRATTKGVTSQLVSAGLPKVADPVIASINLPRGLSLATGVKPTTVVGSVGRRGTQRIIEQFQGGAGTGTLRPGTATITATKTEAEALIAKGNALVREPFRNLFIAREGLPIQVQQFTLIPAAKATASQVSNSQKVLNQLVRSTSSSAQQTFVPFVSPASSAILASRAQGVNASSFIQQTFTTPSTISSQTRSFRSGSDFFKRVSSVASSDLSFTSVASSARSSTSRASSSSRASRASRVSSLASIGSSISSRVSSGSSFATASSVASATSRASRASRATSRGSGSSFPSIVSSTTDVPPSFPILDFTQDSRPARRSRRRSRARAQKAFTPDLISISKQQRATEKELRKRFKGLRVTGLESRPIPVGRSVVRLRF